MNTGIRIPNDHTRYPKKDGILTPFSSAIDFTIKFGAFPIYVLAPMKTAPAEIAVSILRGTIPSEVAIPSVKCKAPAVVRNTRYVGVLSRKLDRRPVVQNICAGSVIPRFAPLAFKSISAGCMVIKIPINSTATSWIAPQVKWFALRISAFVVRNDRNAAQDHSGHDHHQENQVMRPADLHLCTRLADVRL